MVCNTNIAIVIRPIITPVSNKVGNTVNTMPIKPIIINTNKTHFTHA